MTIKAKLLIMLVGAGLFTGMAWAIHKHGQLSCERNMLAAVIALQNHQAALIAELEEARKERDATTIEYIEVIRNVPDPTGCAADTTLGNELDRLCQEGYRPAC